MGLLAALGGLFPNGDGSPNGLQRFGMALDDNNAVPQLALMALAKNPEFAQADPASRMGMVAQRTGNPQALAMYSDLLARKNIDLSNPREAIQQGVKTGQLPLEAGITALSNPMLQMGALSQLTQPAASTAAPAANPAPAAPAPQQKTGIDYDYLGKAKQLAPAAGLMAENMINGTFNMESGKGENDPTYNMALQIARKADPSFTPQALIGRPLMVKNSTNGDMYKLETTLNTGMAHLYDLHELAPQAGNPPNTPYATNYIGGKIVTGLGLPGAQGINRYKGSLTTAAPELAKYLGGGAATDTGTEHANSVFDENLPVDTLQGNAKDMGGKMMAKGGSLQHEYNTAMGAAGTHKVVAPMTEALYADMQGKPLTPEQQKLVNDHRAESNLPPKTWKDSSASSPKAAQVTPEMARAELARRQAERGAR